MRAQIDRSASNTLVVRSRKPQSERRRISRKASGKGTQKLSAPSALPDLSVLCLEAQPPRVPTEVFGVKWSTWLSNTAAGAVCPVDYVVAAVLAAASALIGNARWPQAWPGWNEPPHLWCASVGGSGQGKSPGADVIFRSVIPSIEEQLKEEFNFRRDEAANAHSFSGRQLADDFVEPRFIENDLTVEKVAAVLSGAAPKGLLMARDELAGWLLNMNRFNAGARAFWLEAYGGRPYSIDRMRGPGRILVPRLAVAWHGGIQPCRLRKLLEDADDGLLARFIWFWPNPVEFRRPTTSCDVAFAVRAFGRLSLLEMRPAPQKGAQGEPIIVPLSSAAASELEIFARQAQTWQKNATGLMASAIGKARGLVLRLALILSYLKWAAEEGVTEAPVEIQKGSVIDAIQLVREYFLPAAERVYGDDAARDRGPRTLARWIAQTPVKEVHVRHLQRQVRLPDLKAAGEIHEACEALVEAGWLERPPKGDNRGRSRQAYRIRSSLRRSLKP